MKKGYYLKEVPASHYYSDYYFNEGDAKEMDVWLGGNDRLIEMNNSLMHDVLGSICDAYYEFEEDFSNVEEVVRSYFSRCDGKELTKEEIEAIKNVCCERTLSIDDVEAVAEVLSILKGKQFVEGYIRGCYQGDWLRYICPEEELKKIPYIEMVVFGTGKEFKVSENVCTFEEFCNEEVDVNYVYTDKTSKEDIIKEVFGETKEDVHILMIKDEETKYVYEEM